MEGYDIEEVTAHHQHAWRLIYKVRNNLHLFEHYHEKKFMDDDPDLVVVSYGTPSRVVNTAVEKARAEGLKVGALRLIGLWPFPDHLFKRTTRYLVVELNWDGQLVREVARAAPKDARVHFAGTCGDLPAYADLAETFTMLLNNQPLAAQGLGAGEVVMEYASSKLIDKYLRSRKIPLDGVFGMRPGDQPQTTDPGHRRTGANPGRRWSGALPSAVPAARPSAPGRATALPAPTAGSTPLPAACASPCPGTRRSS